MSGETAQTTQPKDLREGVVRAVQSIRSGVVHLASDFKTPLVTSNHRKGSVGVLGGVLRQIPSTTFLPLVVSCEVSLFK